MHPFNDPRFDQLRLFTVGKQWPHRMMLLAHCEGLGVNNETLSAATNGRFSAEFFRSLGDNDAAMPNPKARPSRTKVAS